MSDWVLEFLTGVSALLRASGERKECHRVSQVAPRINPPMDAHQAQLSRVSNVCCVFVDGYETHKLAPCANSASIRREEETPDGSERCLLFCHALRQQTASTKRVIDAFIHECLTDDLHRH
jgi:hypothetical protein